MATEALEEWIAAQVAEAGFELVLVERAGNPARPIIRIRIDRPDGKPGAGVTVGDCAQMSRALSERLPEILTGPGVVLEVSSAGVDRPLVRPNDWVRFIGNGVSVRLRRPHAELGRRLEGTNLGPVVGDAEKISIKMDNGIEIAVALSEMERATLVYQLESESTMSNAVAIIAAFREMLGAKSISSEELADLIRDGIMAALQKRFGPTVEAEIDLDLDTGRIDIVVLKTVVEEVVDSAREVALEEARWDDPDFEAGNIQEIPIEFKEFGRNAVMAAKQKIIQRVREGERQRIRDEFADKLGELLSGEVQQIERGKMVVRLNRAREADAIIPWKEQNPRERFRQGEPIRAVLKELRETNKGPLIVLSRADAAFVAALFKLEVPEIAQSIVEIKEISREVGGRTKIAVATRDEAIDPVGACVGVKGSRVQAVVSELGGERIDIVPWHPDPEIFAKRALAPARVAKVLSDPEKRQIHAIVEDDQLSLAIGRNGQNVRLASQLIGWQIDLYSVTEWMESREKGFPFGGQSGEDEAQDFPLSELDITPETLATLERAGYLSFFQIIDFELEDFVGIPGLARPDAEALMRLVEELTIAEEEPVEESTAAIAEGDSEKGSATSGDGA